MMEQSRREFLGSSVLGAAGLTSGAAMAALMLDPRIVEAAQDHDNALFNFWTERVRDTSLWTPNRLKARGAATSDTDYTPTFYVSDSGSLTPIKQLGSKDLISSTDVLVDYKVVTYKPSKPDQAKKYASGSLRVDVSQATPPPQFFQPFSWSVVSALALTNNGDMLPPIIKRIVDPSTYWDKNSIVLPGGQGYLANNIFLQEKPKRDLWTFLLGGFSSVVTTAGLFAGVGLPLISQSALKLMDGVYGTVATANSAKTHHVIQTGDMPIAATQSAMSQADPDAPPIPIKTGTYIAVPQWQSPGFDQEVQKDNYMLASGGRLVPKGTTTQNEQELDNLAASDKTMQDYSYVVVKFDVSPYTMPTVPPEIGPLVGNGSTVGGLGPGPGPNPPKHRNP
jgi:hypothetical protein